MSLFRWAAVTVPAVLMLGLVSARLVPSGSDNPWYVALAKPAITPPGWLFPVAWTLLYLLMGLAIAVILNARGSRGRGLAITLFVVQLALNLIWSPTFFGAQAVFAAFLIIVAMDVAAIATTLAFGRIRPLAAWLMVPYLVWISFAGVLNWSIHRMNPNAQALVPKASSTQIEL
nr:TspO/MBR family protein [Sphingomonas japonica]